MAHKILVVGKRGGILLWPEHILCSANDTFEFELQFFAINHHNTMDSFTRKAFKMLKGAEAADRFVADQLSRKIDSFEPDFILIVDLYYLPKALLQACLPFLSSVRFAQWIGDQFEKRMIENAQVVNHFFLTNSALVEAGIFLGLPGSTLLPLGHNPSIFHPGQLLPYQRDRRPLFIGAYSANRELLFQKIQTPIAIYGKGWSPQKLPQHQCHAKNVSIHEVAHLYQKHAVTLNAINSDNISSGLNMRCFEAPAAGSLLVTEDTPDLWACYNKQEVMAYKSVDECQSLLTRIESNLQQAITTAEAGKIRAAHSHTYAMRLRSICASY